jgi:hypothetical protein
MSTSFDEEHDRIMQLIKKAKLTGKPHLVNQWIMNNTVTILAMPDGTLKAYDSNDENIKIPEFEE